MTILAFWAASLFLWAAAVPTAARLFRRFPDAGAGLAFPLGLAIAGYVYFILRVVDVLERGRGGYLVASAFVLLAGLWSWGHSRGVIPAIRRAQRGVVLAPAVFTLFFVGFLFYRSYLPEIGGTEQPMDLLYLTATMESPDYPPHDPWLAGERASYYYFGYLQAGLLSGLSGVEPSVGYNLGLAWTFGAAAAAAVSVAGALGRWALGSRRAAWPAVGATLSVALLLGAGSLAGVFELAAAHERYDGGLYEAFGLESLLPCAPGAGDDCYRGPSPRSTSWYPTEYWFWFRDTRVIPGTIVEFPSFSFLLGDLHPHVMAIPLVLLATGMALTAWRTRRPADWRGLRRDPLAAVLLAVVLGGLAFENAWDLPTFAGLFALATAARSVRERGWASLTSAAGYLVPLFAVAGLLYAPWWVTFHSQAAGLYAYAGEGTSPAHALLQFGAVGGAALAALAWAVPGAGRRIFAVSAAATAVVVAAPAVTWLLFLAGRGQTATAFSLRGDGGWITLVLYGVSLAALLLAAIVAGCRRHGATPLLALAAGGILLLFGTELFFVRDVFFGSVPRLNTVFKLSYQAWVLLSLAGGVGIAGAIRYALRRRDLATAVVAIGALLLLGGALVFPVIAIPNRTDGFSGPRSIDGFSLAAVASPEQRAELSSEYALASWVRQHVPPSAVVVEASGRRWGRGSDGQLTVVDANVDYTGSGRVSARSGRQAPIGWYFHEIQWRGDGIGPELGRRQGLVDAVYTAPDATGSLAALQSLGATYVVVGSLERSLYPADTFPRFDEFLDLVFEDGAVRVYRVPVFRPAGPS